MKKQTYTNHIRYYVPHHFVFYPVLLVLVIASLCCAFQYPDRSLEFGAFAIVFLLLGWLSFMLRQHYALNNQNRIVRLEMRLRYYQLTGQRLEPLEETLSFAQLAALRFASDEELPALLQRAIAENLSATEIKKSVRHWEADRMRV